MTLFWCFWYYTCLFIVVSPLHQCIISLFEVAIRTLLIPFVVQTTWSNLSIVARLYNMRRMNFFCHDVLLWVFNHVVISLMFTCLLLILSIAADFHISFFLWLLLYWDQFSSLNGFHRNSLTCFYYFRFFFELSNQMIYCILILCINIKMAITPFRCKHCPTSMIFEHCQFCTDTVWQARSFGWHAEKSCKWCPTCHRNGFPATYETSVITAIGWCCPRHRAAARDAHPTLHRVTAMMIEDAPGVPPPPPQPPITTDAVMPAASSSAVMTQHRLNYEELQRQINLLITRIEKLENNNDVTTKRCVRKRWCRRDQGVGTHQPQVHLQLFEDGSECKQESDDASNEHDSERLSNIESGSSISINWIPKSTSRTQQHMWFQ